ncbi:MAG TPA: dihydroneopterin aldolase [Burkholderiales bacterium]|nr:dihydroneopterin aldolase [Burkholderiales bacterium]
MDIIFVREFRIEALIGVYEWEKRVRQTIQLDLDIAIPPDRRVGHSDKIRDTIDYSKIVLRIRETLAEERFGLLERLAEHLAQLIMKEFGSPWVRISVAKLGLVPGIKMMGVTIERGKKDKEG